LGGRVEGSGPKTYVLSDDPVVVYVKDFISSEEAAHLITLAYVRPTPEYTIRHLGIATELFADRDFALQRRAVFTLAHVEK